MISSVMLNISKVKNMYLGNRFVHPAVIRVLEEQEVIKPTVVEQVEQHLILEVDSLDPVTDVVVDVDRTHAFVLNENEQYELVKIDEGLGDMLRGAMGWLKWQWGNLKDIFSKKGLPPAWQRSFS